MIYIYIYIYIYFFFLTPTRMSHFPHHRPPRHIAPRMLHRLYICTFFWFIFYYCFIIIYVCLITLHVGWICVFKWVEIEKMPPKKKKFWICFTSVVKVFGPQNFQTRDELFLTWNFKVSVKLHSLCMGKCHFLSAPLVIGPLWSSSYR